MLLTNVCQPRGYRSRARAGSFIANALIWRITGKRLRDSQTGFRAFRKKVLQEVGVSSEGFEVETELTVKMLMKGNDVREVPITVRGPTESKSRLNPLYDGLRILLAIVRAAAKT